MPELAVIPAAPAWKQRHYSVGELADDWGLSHDTVTRLFRFEPGVLEIKPKKRKGWRTRITLRIPEDVATRVYERLKRPAA